MKNKSGQDMFCKNRPDIKRKNMIYTEKSTTDWKVEKQSLLSIIFGIIQLLESVDRYGSEFTEAVGELHKLL